MDNKKKTDLSEEFDIKTDLEQTLEEVFDTCVSAPIEDVLKELEELRAQDQSTQPLAIMSPSPSQKVH